jgi:2-polyprenyl-6-methoxyphenol hydroxylase-like FAD-dependent oxidoreductase
VDKVLVVGGGIAGMTAATALRRVGIDAEIVERSPDWSVYGIGISIQGATLRALQVIGVLDEVVAAGYPYSRLVACDLQGRVTGTIDLPPLLGPGYPECVGIMRPVLQRILKGALDRAGVPVRLGVTFKSIEQDAAGVNVDFTDGRRGRYDLVIGADGIQSSMRAAVFGAGVAPEETGQRVWRAMVPRTASVTSRCMFFGPRHKAGCNPVSDDEMYIFLVQTTAGGGRIANADLAPMMRALLADFGGPIAQVRDAIIDPERIACRPINSMLLDPPWHRGRVVLIGDAVHCPTPQMASGAGMAVEDAIVLAELLAQDGSVEVLLDRFVERRFARCKGVVEASRRVSEWEKTPGLPGADPVGVLSRANAALAAPI